MKIKKRNVMSIIFAQQILSDRLLIIGKKIVLEMSSN